MSNDGERIEKVDGAHERDTRHVKREKCDGSMGGALCVSVRTVVFGGTKLARRVTACDMIDSG